RSVMAKDPQQPSALSKSQGSTYTFLRSHEAVEFRFRLFPRFKQPEMEWAYMNHSTHNTTEELLMVTPFVWFVALVGLIGQIRGFHNATTSIQLLNEYLSFLKMGLATVGCVSFW